MAILTLKKTNGLMLNKAFPDIEYGIFNFLDVNIWNGICATSTLNNMLYFTYGDRIVAPVLAYFMCNDKQPIIDAECLHTIDDLDASTIACMISARYREKWKRMLVINNAEYNPLNNYDMTEKESISASGSTQDDILTNRSINRADTVTNENKIDYSDSKNNVGTFTGKSVNALTDVTENAGTQTADNDNSIYAFNSVAAVPTSENGAKAVTSSSSVNKQDNNTTNDTKTAISETTAGKRDDVNKRAKNESETGKETESRTGTKIDATTRTLTRKGNIGVTTSVQMLKQERDFWIWSYIQVIIEDVANFLTIGVY